MKKGLLFYRSWFALESYGAPFKPRLSTKKALATDIDTMMINHYLKKYFPAIIASRWFLMGFIASSSPHP